MAKKEKHHLHGRAWLMKSEPSTFSIDDLETAPNQTTQWEGVRNYQARNFMRDEMRPGDSVLFYHSNCKTPGVVGLAEISGKPYPDATAFDKNSPYYDPKSDPQNPRWILVDVRFVKKFPTTVTLTELRENPALSDLLILRRGNRLSITPITPKELNAILKMAQ